MAYIPLAISAGTGITLSPSPIRNKGGTVSLASTILTAPYILQSSNATLTGSQNLGALTTGLVKNTVTSGTGVLSTAVAGTDYAAANILGGLAITSTTLSSVATNSSITITPNGTGTINLSKIAVFSQGQRVAITTITADYNPVLTSDYIISVGTISAPITITLPSSPVAGQFYIIKDRAGGANANKITIQGAVAADTLDGNVSIEITQAYGTVSLYCNNVNTWSIL